MSIEILLDESNTIEFEAEIQGVSKNRIVPRLVITTEDGYDLTFNGKMDGDNVKIKLPILASVLTPNIYKCSLEFIMEGERYDEVLQTEIDAILPVKVAAKSKNERIRKEKKPNPKVKVGKTIVQTQEDAPTECRGANPECLVKFQGDTIETKHMPMEIKAVNDDGTFEGYGSMFGNIDSYRDIVEKGAFKKTLHERKNVKMLWQHKHDEVIGVFSEMYEDTNGLYVKGKLALGVQKGRETYELLKMGALDGMSIGYSVIQDEYDSKSDIRHLKELKLYEVSVVTFPANEAATVSQVKSETAVNNDEQSLMNFVNTLTGKSKPDSNHLQEPGIAHSVEPEATHFNESDSSERKETETVSQLTDLLTKLRGK